jgi:hypothetical protein
MGAGTPTLMPTMPALTRVRYSRAAVKNIERPLKKFNDAQSEAD